MHVGTEYVRVDVVEAFSVPANPISAQSTAIMPVQAPDPARRCRPAGHRRSARRDRRGSAWRRCRARRAVRPAAIRRANPIALAAPTAQKTAPGKVCPSPWASARKTCRYLEAEHDGAQETGDRKTLCFRVGEQRRYDVGARRGTGPCDSRDPAAPRFRRARWRPRPSSARRAGARPGTRSPRPDPTPAEYESGPARPPARRATRRWLRDCRRSPQPPGAMRCRGYRRCGSRLPNRKGPPYPIPPVVSARPLTIRAAAVYDSPRHRGEFVKMSSLPQGRAECQDMDCTSSQALAWGRLAPEESSFLAEP